MPIIKITKTQLRKAAEAHGAALKNDRQSVSDGGGVA